MNTSYLSFKNILNNLLKDLSIKKAYIKTLQEHLHKILQFKRRNRKEINFKLLKPNFEPLKKVVITKYITKKVFKKNGKKYFFKTFKKRKLKIINNYPLVKYVVDLTRTRSNYYLNILTSAGKLKLSVSSGNLLNFSTIKRTAAGYYMLNAALKVITKQKYLQKSSIAVHVKNNRDPYKLRLRLKKKRLKLSLFSRFPKRPFNGCRTKKVRSG